MRITKVSVSRSAKINRGNYENTDVSISLEAEIGVGEDAYEVERALMNSADHMLADKIDEIELGERKVASKAGRFGARI